MYHHFIHPHILGLLGLIIYFFFSTAIMWGRRRRPILRVLMGLVGLLVACSCFQRYDIAVGPQLVELGGIEGELLESLLLSLC